MVRWKRYWTGVDKRPCWTWWPL